MKTIMIIAICCISFSFYTTNAQIIYTDIPDTSLVFPEDLGNSSGLSYIYTFNINNDSTFDVKFVLSHHEYLFENVIWVIYTATVGSNDTIATLENGCVKLLEETDTINDSQPWYNMSVSPLLFGRDYYQDKFDTDDWWCNSPNSNKYCGLKLMFDGNIYYGWLRMSWSVSKVVVKDFAYNSTPDMMILAGQIESSSINEINTNNHFNISKYNSQLEITSKKEDQKIERISIYNISGQCNRDKEVNDYKALIDINDLQTGIYIIQIITPENIFVEKYYISN